MPEVNGRLEFKIEGARLIFRNFKGEERQYNAKGERNFACVLDPETAAGLDAEGWNVKWLEPREEGDEATPYLPVKVSFSVRPPRIVSIAGTTRTVLDLETIELLDWAELLNVDMICNGSKYNVNGKDGVKAYLRTMYATIYQDDLEKKYENFGRPETEEDFHNE